MMILSATGEPSLWYHEDGIVLSSDMVVYMVVYGCIQENHPAVPDPDSCVNSQLLHLYRGSLPGLHLLVPACRCIVSASNYSIYRL
jgi:hypothetical protein